MSTKNYQPITVRPAQALRPDLEQLADDLGKSEGQVIGDLLADCLEMLKKNSDFVPKSIRAARALRAHGATFGAPSQGIGDQRDRREVAFYQDDSIQAGSSTGVCCDNPPTMLSIPPFVEEPVDFAVRICGDSMAPVVEEGEIGLFKKTETVVEGRVVAVLVEGQMMLKLYKVDEKVGRLLISLNKKYDAIPVTRDTKIQGIYVGKLPASYLAEEKGRKQREAQVKAEQEGSALF